MKYEDEYHNHNQEHINLFERIETSTKPPPKSILKHTNYRTSSYNNLTQLNTNKADIDSLSATNKHEELNVRGYASKLYRDDSNAIKIESKSNLIPWNGDHDLLIDRYDCRLYLYDLTPHDADLLSEERKNAKLTHEEIEIEELCELERYLDLVNEESDLNQDQINQANSGAYGAVSFNYGTNETTSGQTNTDTDGLSKTSCKEKLFVPSENLKLPIGMLIPETIKMNQLIVKTASFVAKQGLQAEILLKTKQSTNTQFGFLNYENHLNPYYKHLVQLIRENKIDPTEFLKESPEVENTNSNGQTESNSNSENEEENDDDEDDDNYLHPLLSKALSASKPSPRSPVKNETSEIENSTSIPVTINSQDKSKEIQETTSLTQENDENIEEPEGTTKVMIDKLAEYVVRNGIEFETNLKQKNDERFDFLNEGHKYYKYYKNQVQIKSKEIKLEKEKEENRDDERKDEEKRKSRSERSRSSRSSKSHKKSRKSSKDRRTEEKRTRSSSTSSSSRSSKASDSEEEGEARSDKEKKSKDKRKHKRRSHHKESSSRRKRSHSESSSRRKHRKRSKERQR